MNMKRSSLAAALALLTAGPLWAHHAISAVFDTTKQIKVVGELTDVDWVNPHIFIHLKAKNSAGAMVSWKAESGPPAWYRRVGANKATFSKHIGESITINGLPAKDGSTYGFLQRVTFANGDTMESASAADVSGKEK